MAPRLQSMRLHAMMRNGQGNYLLLSHGLMGASCPMRYTEDSDLVYEQTRLPHDRCWQNLEKLTNSRTFAH